MKSVFSVIAGYVVMTVLVVASFAVLAVLVPAQMGAEATGLPGTGMLLLILAFGLLAAMVGGGVTGRLSPRAPGKHIIALASLIAAIGVVGMIAGGGQHPAPAWYQAGILVEGIAGSLLGGRLWLMRQPQAQTALGSAA
jgi:hypothetical protein